MLKETETKIQKKIKKLKKNKKKIHMEKNKSFNYFRERVKVFIFA